MLNMVVVIGKLVKPMQVRHLPSGLRLASFDLQVPRSDESTDTVPVALFNSGESTPDWVSGQELLAVGRVRRRFFRVGGTTQSRTEVVADHVFPLAQREDVGQVLTEAQDALAVFVQELGLA